MSKLIFVGIVVLTLAIFLGLVATFASTPKAVQAPSNNVVLQGGLEDLEGDFQEVFVKATSAGIYDNSYISVKQGVPVKFNFSAEPASGCGKVLLIPEWNVYLLSANGETKSATFTPTQVGKFEFHCSMKMFRGTLEVVP